MPSFPEGHNPKWWKDHPEKLAIAIAQRDQRKTSEYMPPPPETTRSKIIGYLRSIGFVAFVLAIGTVLMEDYYWYFVAFAYIGIIAALVDCILEGPRAIKPVLCLLYVVFLFGFTLIFVRGRYYPELNANWNSANYPIGEDVHGVPWQKDWSYLSLSIFNGNDSDIKDLDIEFYIDESLEAIKQIDTLPCHIVPSGPTFFDPSAKVNGVQQPVHVISTRQAQRIICDKIPGRTGPQIMIALKNDRAMMSLLLDHQLPENGLTAEKVAPSPIHAHVKYKSRLRPYSYDEVIPMTVQQ